MAIFPEGTVGPGDELLPFRSTLLEAVNVAPGDVEVRPVAIDYGAATPEIAWHGESGEANVRRLLGRKGSFPVTIRLLPALPPRLDRKALAQAARDAIGASLASSRAEPRLYAPAK